MQNVFSRGVKPRALQRQSGQGLVEYALILIMVSIVAILILISMGDQLKTMFSDVVGVLHP